MFLIMFIYICQRLTIFLYSTIMICFIVLIISYSLLPVVCSYISYLTYCSLSKIIIITTTNIIIERVIQIIMNYYISITWTIVLSGEGCLVTRI